MALFEKGNPGKPKGAVTKSTKLVKEVFAEVFAALQDGGPASLENWAKEQPTEFYKLASKLIPTQISGDPDQPLEIKTDLSKLSTEELSALATAVVKLRPDAD